ncbi:MAG TPA: hypothetical protein VMG55_21910 [Stellaceae bacterium]|nr:hypothetical protein [Stellaceae bacterium]
MSETAHESFLVPPRSAVDTVVWPALLPEWQARLLAVQFQLEQSEWWTPEELRQHQFEQLAQVAAHAFRSVPFYRDPLSAAGYREGEPLGPEIWVRLPVLGRKALRENADALTSRAIPPAHGKVAELTLDPRPPVLRVRKTELTQLFTQAFILREEIWHRRDLAGKQAAIVLDPTGGSRYPAGRSMPDWGPPMGPLYGTGPLVILDATSDVGEQMEWLEREKPAYLAGLPETIGALARRYRATGKTLPGLLGVRTGSGTIDAEFRALCRAAWGVPVTAIIRVEEVGTVALQCPRQELYHVQSEGLLLEVLRPDGSACGPGETGRLVATTLHNFAMPLLRYVLDLAAELGPPCSCGRGLPVLTRVMAA